MEAAEERMQTRRRPVKNRVNEGGEAGGVTQHDSAAGAGPRAFYLLDDSFEAHGECIRKRHSHRKKKEMAGQEKKEGRGNETDGGGVLAVSRGVL